MLLWVSPRRDSMVTDSVALLMGSPECCERHFGGSTLDFANHAGGNARFSALSEICF
jgi:hypothetical protein